MKLLANIKCFFGFCAEKKEIELRERIEIEKAYGKDPIVVEIKKPVEQKRSTAVFVPKLKEDNSDDTRDWSWYNNSEVNLRVYENETIPEGYVKGMKSRKKKGDK